MQFLTDAKLKYEFTDEDSIKWYSLKYKLVLYTGKEPYLTSSGLTRENVIIVPAETFLSDLASVPKIFQSVFKPNGKYTRAALIHDFLYSKKEVNRFAADKIFLEAMKIDEVPFFTRYLFYAAVTFFGSSSKA